MCDAEDEVKEAQCDVNQKFGSEGRCGVFLMHELTAKVDVVTKKNTTKWNECEESMFVYFEI
jgi:hypothetical protein